jgi:hypothetical protein
MCPLKTVSNIQPSRPLESADSVPLRRRTPQPGGLSRHPDSRASVLDCGDEAQRNHRFALRQSGAILPPNSKRARNADLPIGRNAATPRPHPDQEIGSSGAASRCAPMNCSFIKSQIWGLLLIALLLTSCTLSAADPASTPDDITFIDNGQIRIGVKKSSGCGIAWFSAVSDGRNLVNHWDRGRLIQQSYYGREDGSMWDKQPWRWNPVQGGDWKGSPATTLEFKLEKDSIYAKSQGKHWASGVELTNVVFEETIRLLDDVVHVHFKFTYSGEESHPVRDQEIPAVFMEPDLDTLVLYDGDQPWTGGELNRSKPGWPNESRRMTEHWAAYVDQEGNGLGVLVPVADNLTCYRFGDGKREHGSCSYFAPLTRFAVTPGKVFEYDIYLTAGTVDEIRARFNRVSKN